MESTQLNDPQDSQIARPIIAKIFNWLLLISTIIITLGWTTLFFYRNTPILETPPFVNDLNILWLPLATIAWLYFIGPLCLILSTLFKSHTVPKIYTSTKQRLIIGTGAGVYGVLFIHNTLTTFNAYREDILQPLNALVYLAIGIILVTTTGLVWLTIALGRRQSWAVFPALFLGTGLTIASLLELLHRLTPPIDDLGLIALSTIFTLIFAGLTITIHRYRHLFSGHPRKLWLQIPLLLVLIVQVGFAVQTQLYLDDFSVQDSDLLQLTVIPLPAEENAYSFLPTKESMSSKEITALERAVDYYREVGSDSSHTIPASSSLILEEAKLAATGTENLVAAFVEASTKIVYQCPTSLNSFHYDKKLCALNTIRDLASLVALHNLIATLEGNDERAVKLSLAILKMGKLMSDTEHPTLVDYLVARALLGIGTNSLYIWLDHTTSPSPELLRSVTDNMPNYTLELSAITRAYRTEYMILRTSLLTDPLESQGLNLPDELILFPGKATYMYLPNKTTNEVADYYRSFLTLTEAPCSTDVSYQEEILVAQIQFTSSEYLAGPLTPNLTGKTLLAVYLASFNDVKNTRCEHNEKIEILLERLQNS